MNETPDTSFTRAIATESLADFLGNVSELALDSALDAGTLRDLPVIGTILSLLKAGRDIRDKLFLRKIANFLKEISVVPQEQRIAFVQKLQTEDAQHQFGKAILPLLERAEDMKKPKIIGRIIAARILGQLDEAKAMRICSIVDRCYVQDLEHLKSFKDRVQGDFTSIVELLHAAGVVSNCGSDGENEEENSSGVIYCINEYGDLLVKYGLGVG